MYIRSSSTSSGFCTITVTFEIGRDPDLAAVDVQNRVNQALGRMPADVRHERHHGHEEHGRVSRGASASSRATTATTRCSSATTSTCTSATRSKRIPGVGNIIIFGERKFAMRLWLDPGQAGRSRPDGGRRRRALREQNVQVAAGSVGDSPAAADQMFQLSVRAEGRLTEVAEFEHVVVKAGTDGALVRVSDVGRVELGAESYTSRLRFGGVEASGIGIQPLPTANAIEVFDGVRDRARPSAEGLSRRGSRQSSRSTTSRSCANRSSRCS